MQVIGKLVTGVLAIGLAGAAVAQDGLPPLQNAGGVSYMTGGIGLDESAAIKAAEKDFNLSLLFAQSKRGEYLADIKVSIADKAGKTVLKVVADGPMLLVRLPAGAYKVSAEHGGKTLVKTVQVAVKGVARASFVWEHSSKATIE
jgi:hypothetical protein